MKSWGMTVSIDLFDCGIIVMRSHGALKRFALELCQAIRMNPYGVPVVRRFGNGELEGNSMFQFIQTSSITVHCDEMNGRVFIDIFSCKSFDAKLAAAFSARFFNAQKVKMKVIERG